MMGFLLFLVVIAAAYIRRFRSEFTEDDVQSVGAYILVSVIIWIIITVIVGAS